MLDRKDFFDLVSGFNHSIGLYLTFTIDNDAIAKLADSSKGNVIILYDHRQGKIQEDNFKDQVLRIPVALTPDINSRFFHPKIALLKGENEALLIIGSANMTRSSFETEKELACSVRISYNSKMYFDVIEYFKSLKFFLVSTQGHYLENLEKYFNPIGEISNEAENVSFITNHGSQSIFEKLKSLIPDAGNSCDELIIFSPFYSTEYANYFNELSNLVNPKKIQFGIRPETGIPDSLCKENNKVSIIVPRGKAYNKFHFKLYLFRYKKFDLVLMGSPNFTRSGFFLSTDQNGNFESALIFKLYNKQRIDKWLKAHWEPAELSSVSPFNEDILEDDVLVKEAEYGWAEKYKEKTFVYLFMPPNYVIHNLTINNIKVKWVVDQRVKGVIFTSGDFGSNIVIKYNGKKLFEIVATNMMEFDRQIQGMINSFCYDSDPIYGLNFPMMKGEIKKKGIYTNIRGVRIEEAPALEQFYKNVRDKSISAEKQKNYFEYDRLLLEKNLFGNSGAEALYLAGMFYRIFKKKRILSLEQMCLDRMNSILEDPQFKEMKRELLIQYFEQ